MTEKQGKYSRFIDWVTAKKKDASVNVKVEGLPDHALKLIQDKRLIERKEEYVFLLKLLHEPIDMSTLNSYINDLTEMVKITHMTVCDVAGIYARSGDDHRFARMMWGWDGLYSLNLGDCLKVKKYWGSDEQLNLKEKPEATEDLAKTTIALKNLDHVYHLHLGLINHYFNKAFNVLNYCFRDIDVRAQSVTVIQTMLPARGQTPWGYEDGLTPQPQSK